jgi:hypothetical protein
VSGGDIAARAPIFQVHHQQVDLARSEIVEVSLGIGAAGWRRLLVKEGLAMLEQEGVSRNELGDRSALVLQLLLN